MFQTSSGKKALAIRFVSVLGWRNRWSKAHRWQHPSAIEPSRSLPRAEVPVLEVAALLGYINLLGLAEN